MKYFVVFTIVVLFAEAAFIDHILKKSGNTIDSLKRQILNLETQNKQLKRKLTIAKIDRC